MNREYRNTAKWKVQTKDGNIYEYELDDRMENERAEGYIRTWNSLAGVKSPIVKIWRA